jgi:hypothetical protein
MKSKLRVDVNKNPTKTGIKVQFVLPETLEGDAKTEATQKLQSKLNQGLSQYNLTVSQDTDVPYSNVIGFLIPIADIKLLIKNAMGGETQAEPAPEEAPAPEAAPEEPIKEIKRMQELAGLKEFQDVSSEDFQIEEVNRIIAAAIRAITSDVDKQDKIFDFFEITKDNKYNTFIIAKQLAAGKINVEGIKMKVANVAKKLGIM